MFQQIVPTGRGQTQPEIAGKRPGETAVFEVGDRLVPSRMLTQGLAIEVGTTLHQRIERLIRRFPRERIAATSARLAGHLQAHAAGQIVHGLGKVEVLVVHEKTEGVTAGAATEAVVELLFRIDAEGGGFLVVEGAARAVVFTGLLEFYAAIDDIHDVDAIQKIVNKGLRNSSGHDQGLRPARRGPAQSGCGGSRRRAAALAIAESFARRRLSGQAGFDFAADRAHIGATLKPGFELAHNRAHSGHTGAFGTRYGLLDQCVEFAVGELGGEEILDDRDLRGLAGSQFIAPGSGVLLPGVAALLEHFVQNRQHAAFVECNALVHFDAFEFRLDQAQGREACFVAAFHRGFHSRLYGRLGG